MTPNIGLRLRPALSIVCRQLVAALVILVGFARTWIHLRPLLTVRISALVSCNGKECAYPPKNENQLTDMYSYLERVRFCTCTVTWVHGLMTDSHCRAQLTPLPPVDEMPSIPVRPASVIGDRIKFRVHGHGFRVGHHEGAHFRIACQACFDTLLDPIIAVLSCGIDQHRRLRDDCTLKFRKYLL